MPRFVRALVAVAIPATLAAQAGPRYPIKPKPFPEADEIALARSAAPDEISAQADVYVLRETGPVKVHTGTNGAACMVNRDLHEGSLYPICFDREGVQTNMQRELMELRLRVEGKAEEDIERAVKEAFAKGTLRAPARPSVAYMMSPRQVLFSSARADGRHVGAWHPHLMIAMPNAKGSDFGLATPSKIEMMSFDYEGTPSAQLVVHVPTWSNGQPAHAGGK